MREYKLYLIALTIVCIGLAITRIPELCAISIMLSIYTTYGWGAYLNKLDKHKAKIASITPTLQNETSMLYFNKPYNELTKQELKKLDYITTL